jgi:hypothetical protein
MVVTQTAFITTVNRSPVSVVFRAVMIWCTVIMTVTWALTPFLPESGSRMLTFRERLLGFSFF